MASTEPLPVWPVRWPALPAAPGGRQAGARYRLPGRDRPPLPVSTVPADLSGLPDGGQARAHVAAGDGAGGPALPAGAQLRRGGAGLGRAGALFVQVPWGWRGARRAL